MSKILIDLTIMILYAQRNSLFTRFSRNCRKFSSLKYSNIKFDIFIIGRI